MTGAMALGLTVLCLACSGRIETEPEPPMQEYEVRHTLPDSVVAGMTYEFQFQIDPAPEQPAVAVSTAWGATSIPLTASAGGYSAVLPTSFGRLAGPMDWTLHSEHGILDSGHLLILANPRSRPILESYAGPSHLQLGQQDRASFVALPVDIWDNPLPDSTLVNIRWGFDGEAFRHDVLSANMVAVQEFQAQRGTGSLRFSAAMDSSISKNRSIQVLAGVPVNFRISLHRSHAYADGSSLLRVLAGPLEDEKGNLVPDGTMVMFRKRDDRGDITELEAVSLNGIAEAFFRFPSAAGQWTVRAGVLGFGQSREEVLSFSAAVTHSPVRIGELGRRVKIGPVSMVKGGLVPDGFPCELQVLDTEGALLWKKQVPLRIGRADFYLDKDEIPDGRYQLKVQCGDFNWARSTDIKSSSSE